MLWGGGGCYTSYMSSSLNDIFSGCFDCPCLLCLLLETATMRRCGISEALTIAGVLPDESLSLARHSLGFVTLRLETPDHNNSPHRENILFCSIISHTPRRVGIPSPGRPHVEGWNKRERHHRPHNTPLTVRLPPHRKPRSDPSHTAAAASR